MTLLNEILAVALAAAPWLLLGLLAAGLIKGFVPDTLLQRWAGGRGVAGIARAAVIAAPLPLCSCGAIPTALALHRGGAGRGPTTAFMVGTPGVGVDSLVLTYVLLGPLVAVARAAGAVVTAISTGLLVARTETTAKTAVTDASPPCNGQCSSEPAPADPATSSITARLGDGMHYAFGKLLDDISAWVLLGLLVAGVLFAFVPPQALAAYGSGLLPMLLMATIGIPLYICAAAATPIAAGMIMVGVSPGTALVFLLAGPITSLATLGILRREFGNRALSYYLIGILATTVIIGLLVDALFSSLGFDVLAQTVAVRELLPTWLEWSALAVLVASALRQLRRRLFRVVAEAPGTDSAPTS